MLESTVLFFEYQNVFMAELTGVVRKTAGGELRSSMAEVFVMHNEKIAERRA